MQACLYVPVKDSRMQGKAAKNSAVHASRLEVDFYYLLVLSAYLPILLILKQHTQLFHTVDDSFGNEI